MTASFFQYAQPVTKRGKSHPPAADANAEPPKLSNHAQRNLDDKKKSYLDPSFDVSAIDPLH